MNTEKRNKEKRLSKKLEIATTIINIISIIIIVAVTITSTTVLIKHEGGLKKAWEYPDGDYTYMHEQMKNAIINDTICMNTIKDSELMYNITKDGDSQEIRLWKEDGSFVKPEVAIEGKTKLINGKLRLTISYPDKDEYKDMCYKELIVLIIASAAMSLIPVLIIKLIFELIKKILKERLDNSLC